MARSLNPANTWPLAVWLGYSSSQQFLNVNPNSAPWRPVSRWQQLLLHHVFMYALSQYCYIYFEISECISIAYRWPVLRTHLQMPAWLMVLCLGKREHAFFHRTHLTSNKVSLKSGRHVIGVALFSCEFMITGATPVAPNAGLGNVIRYQMFGKSRHKKLRQLTCVMVTGISTSAWNFLYAYYELATARISVVECENFWQCKCATAMDENVNALAAYTLRNKCGALAPVFPIDFLFVNANF
jgi:hypothetical protein